MDKEIIAQMYEYGIWANRKLLDKAAALTDEQLRHKFTEGAQPILHTFAHLVGAELRWYQSWIGAPLTERLTVDDLPTLDVVRAKWEPLFAERRAFIASLTPERLSQPIVRKLQGASRASFFGTRSCTSRITGRSIEAKSRRC